MFAWLCPDSGANFAFVYNDNRTNQRTTCKRAGEVGRSPLDTLREMCSDYPRLFVERWHTDCSNIDQISCFIETKMFLNLHGITKVCLSAVWNVSRHLFLFSPKHCWRLCRRSVEFFKRVDRFLLNSKVPVSVLENASATAHNNYRKRAAVLVSDEEP